MEHLKMQTANKADENYRKLSELFPNAVTETIDENGEVVRAIDKDVLMQEIAVKVVDGREERYQFTWPDKKKSVLLANAPISKTLRPCREESVDFDNTENLYIEGDNLEVLKLLQETYLGKVKMIYIDPPYNTGNDFVYEDDFRTESLEFRKKSGNFDEEGNQLVDNYTRNTESNGRFHTDWLNMIYPRLRLAKDLLTDDGVIFISIDDNEVASCQFLVKEIFGESNFVAQFVWKSKLGKVGTTSTVAVTHEYILCSAKNIENVTFAMIENHNVGRKENLRQWGVADRREDRPSMFYPISINGKTVLPIKEDGTEGRWRVGEDMAKELLANGELELSEKNGKLNIYRKFSESISVTPYDTLLLDEIGTTAKGAIVLKNLGMAKIFDFSKPVELIKHFIKISTNHCQLTTNNYPLILDFFSGSATTAHAVMQLNAEEIENVELSIKNLDRNDPEYNSKLQVLNSKLQTAGHRKFIMVQLPEATAEKSEAYKAGYKNICEIGKERIRRAGKQILELRLESLEKEGIIEKIDDTKFSVLSSKDSKKKEGVIEKDARELSEIRSLEEVYGCGGTSVSACKETSTGGNLRAVRPNEKSGGVDSLEHCGGAVKGKKGIYPIFENSKGFTSRTGDTIVDLRTLEVLNRFGYRINFGYIRGNQQNDLFSDSEFKLQTLRAKLSFLRSDHGFRVLKCDTSNMEDVYYTPEHIDKSTLFKDNIKSDRTGEDLLFQTMLDLGIMLSSKIETRKINGKDVFCVEDNYLMACFDKDVTEDVITEIAKMKPYYFVMRDPADAQDGDSLITNFEQIFTTYSPDTVRKVL